MLRFSMTLIATLVSGYLVGEASITEPKAPVPRRFMKW